MKDRAQRWTWWSDAFRNARGTPLCAVLRPAGATTADTDEMSPLELEDAFLEAGWPFLPCPSWAEESRDD